MTGDLYIGVGVGNVSDIQLKDAYLEYGISLEPSAMAALMTPPGMKEMISFESRIAHGKRILNKMPRFADRDVALSIHINAKTVESFLSRYQKFCDNVLAAGEFIVNTKYQPDVYYRFYYNSCNNYSEFRMEYASFTLKLNEPDPTNRGEKDKYSEI